MEISSHPTSPAGAMPEPSEENGAQMVFHQWWGVRFIVWIIAPKPSSVGYWRLKK
jgi:hypothetical protein